MQLPHFDIHIITCQQTSHRLSELLTTLRPLLECPFIIDIRLMAKYDIGSFDESFFDDALWDSHIDPIFPILAKNICVSSGMPLSQISKLLSIGHHAFFPPRPLRDAEKSLVSKHFHSLNSVTRTTLVLEDDILLDSSMLHLLYSSIEVCANENLYLDLGHLPHVSFDAAVIDQTCIKRVPIALTRTNCAYVVSPAVAKTMVKSYFPCSLPADLHHQYIFLINNIAGGISQKRIFMQKSLMSLEPSSVQPSPDI
jgi:hypothetical protein